MRYFEVLQRQMLRDMRQSQSWIVAEVNHGDVETVKYALEFNIPKDQDVVVFQTLAYTLISELGLGFEADAYTLNKNGREVAMLVTVDDPKIVDELISCKARDIKSANIKLQFLTHEREQNPELRAKDISSFVKEMRGETTVRYHLFANGYATRTGTSYRSQKAANKITEKLMSEVRKQEQAEAEGLSDSIENFRR